MIYNPDEIIDGWSLLLREYPFTRKGMTAWEYYEEKQYYMSVGLDDIKNLRYKP